MQMLFAIIFVVYSKDQIMLRLQPKLKRHMRVLSLYLVTKLWFTGPTAKLPAMGSTSVVQPLPQAPLRHFKSLQVALEAQPAALLEDVLTATNVPAMNAPHDQQQEEGADDVQQTQQMFGVCWLDVGAHTEQCSHR